MHLDSGQLPFKPKNMPFGETEVDAWRFSPPTTLPPPTQDEVVSASDERPR